MEKKEKTTDDKVKPSALGQLYITWDDDVCGFRIPNVDINSDFPA